MKSYRNCRAMIKYSFFLFVLLIISFLWIFLLEKIKYVCPFRKLFHIWCPGCGGTRMVKAIFHLEFYQAFRYNPLLFILLIMGLFYLLYMLIIYYKEKIVIKPSNKSIVFFIILLVIYMILRNIPTFSYLIPTKV